MANIEIRDVSLDYRNQHTGEIVHALEGVNLTVNDGEFVTIVGPSGCGKSTTLYIVAGLLRPTTGEVLVEGQPVKGPGADRGMVFQDVAILPWRTVGRNIAHGLEIQGVPPKQREEIVDYFVRLCGLKGFEDKYPHELSGGMRQRVAVARTLAVRPKVVLMDEPFAALDAQTRVTLGEELLRITLDTRNTVLFVTHNVEEAVFLGDRVVVFTHRPGRVKCEFKIPVPREERTYQEMIHSAQLEDVKRAIFETIREEVAASGEDVPSADAGGSGGGISASRGRTPWWKRRTVVGGLMVLGAAAAIQAASIAGAAERMSEGVAAAIQRGGAERVEVRVTVPVEEFHLRYLQQWGLLERVEGDVVRLRDVSSDGLTSISRLYWVEEVYLTDERGL